MKQYIGIDIAKHEHVLGARFEDGRQHGKAFAFANDERGFASLLERLRELDAAPESSLVVMESDNVAGEFGGMFLGYRGGGVSRFR